MYKVHKVKSGETLGGIAIQYLGLFNKWQEIKEINPQLVGRGLAVDSSPLIYPNDVLNIPIENTTQSNVPRSSVPIVLDSEGDDTVSIIIDGVKFTGFSSYTLEENYDSFDTFSFSAPYDNSIKELNVASNPFSFKNVSVYYEKKLQFNGVLLTPQCGLQDNAKTITFSGYPLCGVLNDCTLPITKYPTQYDGKNIKQIASDMASPYGIKVEATGSIGASFSEVAYDPAEKIFAFLSNLTKQRNLLMTNTVQGDLLIFESKKNEVVANYKEGEVPLMSITPSFNAQEFYSHITGFTKTNENKDSLRFTYENKFLKKQGVFRCQTITVDDAESQTDLENAVKSYAGRMFANSVSYTITIEGHKTQNGALLKKGDFIKIASETAKINKETAFLIRKVQRIRDSKGNSTVLQVVFPESFTGEIPEVLAWEK
ncbi:MAG: LysM peptidoglycan-binding domain-containing protein [Treponemataceae bacterium]